MVMEVCDQQLEVSRSHEDHINILFLSDMGEKDKSRTRKDIHISVGAG